MDRYPMIMELGELMLEILEDDEDERADVPKSLHFLEQVIPRFNDKQFQAHFRMNPGTFQFLLGKIHSVLPEAGPHPGRPQILLEKQLFLTVWYMANLECIRSVADRFAVTKSTAWESMGRILRNIIEANLRFGFILWPNDQKVAATAAAFENISGFPGVLGVIDGCHIKILPPQQHPNSYYNRKKFHSILLQGVCDENKMFIDVFAGVPGSCHDMRLFDHSDLKDKISDNQMFPNDTHLIGDLAYMLQKHLMVGFKDNGHLNDRQKNFNKKLNIIRVTIENTFALLKGRFRRLKFLETVRLDLIVLFIVVGCIFHNICMINNDILDDIDMEREVENIRRNQPELIPLDQGQNRQEGARKRELIMNNLAMVN